MLFLPSQFFSPPDSFTYGNYKIGFEICKYLTSPMKKEIQMITCQKRLNRLLMFVFFLSCPSFPLHSIVIWQPNYNGVYKYFHFLYPIDYMLNDYDQKISMCMCDVICEIQIKVPSRKMYSLLIFKPTYVTWNCYSKLLTNSTTVNSWKAELFVENKYSNIKLIILEIILLKWVVYFPILFNRLFKVFLIIQDYCL